jgi:hypothetical protein
MGTKAKKKAAVKAKPRSKTNGKVKSAAGGRSKATAKKAKAPAKKKAAKKVQAKKSTAKKAVNRAAVRQVKRPLKKPKAASNKKQQASADVIPPGKDEYLIPVQGEIHPARIEERTQIEKVVQHNQNVALHQEEQKAKAALANSRAAMKRTFPRPRQS